jgi:hypothetical protein
LCLQQQNNLWNAPDEALLKTPKSYQRGDPSV